MKREGSPMNSSCLSTILNKENEVFENWNKKDSLEIEMANRNDYL
jgi:hypothetical protein